MPADNLPIGTIFAFAGQRASLEMQTTGWLLCDGSQLAKTQYPDLYNILQNLWGDFSGTSKEYFKLPDLRGVFLRGVSGDRQDNFKDPDAEARSHTFTKANEAGSFQQDEFEAHSHLFNASQPPNTPPHMSGSGGSFPEIRRDTNTSTVGGNETRPKNAYVHYMIKAKN